MRRPPLALLVTTAAAIAALAIASGCSSKSSNPTAPGGGGGGGGGTSATINSGTIAGNGGSFTFTFPDTGTTGYHCGIHPTIMKGNSISVTSTSPNDSMVVQIVSTSTPGYSPSAATIRPGGHVRWVNVDGMSHSVEND